MLAWELVTTIAHVFILNETTSEAILMIVRWSSAVIDKLVTLSDLAPL